MAHTHAHGHHHHSTPREVTRKLVIACVLMGGFVFVEAAAGFWANSLALLGDAIHNLTDTIALLIAFTAVRIAQRPATAEKSYGYQRAGILAAFVNAASLLGVTAFLFYEAIERLRTPHAVDTGLMLVTASVAVVLNVGVTLSLRHEGERDVNIRSAEIHMLGDALSSAGIVVASILMRVTGSLLWDPAITVLIALMIVWSSWGILREAVNLLLEGTPSGIDPQAVIRSLETIEGIEGIHHLHIWALGPSSPALSCHVMVGDIPLRSTAALLEKINSVLEHEHRIVHTTIQFEPGECPADDPFCSPVRR
jgi:cobalt-zinc-cadmium efflux system protein